MRIPVIAILVTVRSRGGIISIKLPTNLRSDRGSTEFSKNILLPVTWSVSKFPLGERPAIVASDRIAVLQAQPSADHIAEPISGLSSCRGMPAHHRCGRHRA